MRESLAARLNRDRFRRSTKKKCGILVSISMPE